MRPIKKLVAVTGTYTDRQTGQEKKQYVRIGTMFKDDEKDYVSLKIESMPVGDGWNGWVSVYDLDGQQAADKAGLNEPAHPAPAPGPDAFEEDSIPF